MCMCTHVYIPHKNLPVPYGCPSHPPPWLVPRSSIVHDERGEQRQERREQSEERRERRGRGNKKREKTRERGREDETGRETDWQIDRQTDRHKEAESQTLMMTTSTTTGINANSPHERTKYKSFFLKGGWMMDGWIEMMMGQARSVVSLSHLPVNPRCQSIQPTRLDAKANQPIHPHIHSFIERGNMDIRRASFHLLRLSLLATLFPACI